MLKPPRHNEYQEEHLYFQTKLADGWMRRGEEDKVEEMRRQREKERSESINFNFMSTKRIVITKTN